MDLLLDTTYIQTVINDLKTMELEYEILGQHSDAVVMGFTINVLEERIRLLEMCEIMCGGVEED